MATRVQGNNLNLNGNQLLNALLQVLAADPGSPAAGRVWFNSNDLDGVVRYRNQAGVTITLGRLNDITAPDGPVDFNSQRLTSVGDPTAGSDGVNRNYVDMLVSGIKGVKDPVTAVADTNIDVASPGAAINGATLDAAGTDSVLLTAQTDGTENGIYTWNGAASALTRRADANAAGEIVDGTAVSVAEGNGAGTIYLQQATPNGAPGAWTQNWTQFGGGTTYSAGTGLDLTGNTFSLETPVTVAHGGTGGATAADARASLGVPGKYVEDIGDGSTTVITVTHNLGSLYVDVTVFKKSNGEEWDIPVAHASANTVTLDFAVAPAADEFGVVVIG